MKLPFPDFLLNTPVTVYKTELGEDGPEEEKIFEGKCIYTDKTKQVMTAEKQLITLTGKVVIKGALDIKEGYVIVNETKKIIYSVEKPINPDGSIFSTELNLT
ncbi:MAG: hypothetical protein E7214_14910 [Clostridium sp.]|nr:hypothetical protein [Clostridium sp.]